jgi:nucleoside-diphosphate-sugar epimerase
MIKWIAEGEPVTVTGDGNQMRGFTYLDDIADGVVRALKPVGYEIINLGGHETITINELVQKLESSLGKKAQVEYIPRHPADVDANWAEVSNARRLLGWEPQVTLDAGITQTVNWYLQNREWARDILTP